MASVTTSGSSKKVGGGDLPLKQVNVLLDKPRLKELSDIKNALNTDAVQMASVMKYAFFQDISFDQVVSRIFGMINHVDANERSDVLKVSLMDQKAVLISNIILSPTERCIKFNVGAANVLIFIKLVGKLGIEISIHLKISLGGISIMDEHIGKFILGEARTLFYSNGISYVNPTIKFGKNNTLITNINGSVGLPPFNASFGEYKKIIDLNGFNNINYIDDKGDEKLQQIASTVSDGTKYLIKVTNSSGADTSIGIFQTDPNNPSTGVPVVWAYHGVSNGGFTSFEWPLSWYLSWFTSEQQVSGSTVITITSQGKLVPVSPAGPNNTAALSYSETNKIYNIVSGTPNSTLPSGTIEITTDNSFTVAQATNANLNVGVWMGPNLVFCMAGLPNSTYRFGTHPTYYVSPYTTSANEVVSATVIGKATKAVFNGTFALGFTLNSSNVLVPSQAPPNPNN